MNYYTQDEHGNITAFAGWKFAEDVIETDKEFMHGRDSKLYFQGEEPPLPLAEARAAALETLRLRKWKAKEAGITVNGTAIDTDDRGQSTISGAVTNVLMDPAFTARWKTSAVDEYGASVWVELDGPLILGLAKAMTGYTEACFAVEAVKQAEIVALAKTEDISAWLEIKLDTGWPSREITLDAA